VTTPLTTLTTARPTTATGRCCARPATTPRPRRDGRPPG
jgi:hypothetical protein